MLRDAVFAPAVVGLKRTVIVQLPPGATDVHPLVPMANWFGLAPVNVAPLTTRVPVPVLLTVTFCSAELVVMFWLPKASDAGETDATGVTPVPVTVNVAGDPEALWVIDTDAVFAPTDVGANLTLTVQLAAGANVVHPLVIPNWPASVPVRVALLTTRVAVPVLVTVMFRAAEGVPVLWLPKAREPAVIVAAGATPVPLSVNVDGDPAALWLIVTVAVFEPTDVGTKLTKI
jgi:hypothetical protein